jgi:PAS domain S-box-containing protein
MSLFSEQKTVFIETIVLVFLALILASTIFFIHINASPSIAIGAMYSIVVLYSWLLTFRMSSIYTGLACTVLVIFGASSIECTAEQQQALMLNTIISIIAIWICSMLVLIAKQSFRSVEKAKNNLDVLVKESTAELAAKTTELKAQRDLLKKSEGALLKLMKELTENEKNLKASERKFRGLLEAAPDPFVILNEEGDIILANTETTRLFGYAKEEIEGRNIDLLIPYQVHFSKESMQTEGSESSPIDHLTEKLELMGLDSKQHKFPVEISSSPLKIEKDIFTFIAIRNISE